MGQVYLVTDLNSFSEIPSKIGVQLAHIFKAGDSCNAIACPVVAFSI